VAHEQAAFRRVGPNGDQVELRGTIVSQSGVGEQTVFVLPEGYRPREEQHFQVECEGGTTVVTLARDGSVLADPGDGWVRLDGIVFDRDD
jgi:hypothetical protein